MFRPNGLDVSARNSSSSARTAAAVLYPAARKPRPPASETAAASAVVAGPPASGAPAIGTRTRSSTTALVRVAAGASRTQFASAAETVLDSQSPSRGGDCGRGREEEEGDRPSPAARHVIRDDLSEVRALAETFARGPVQRSDLALTFADSL